MNAPENARPDHLGSGTDSLDDLLFVCDGPWDKTIRPARQDLPREYPRPNLKPRPQADEEKPKEG